MNIGKKTQYGAIDIGLDAIASVAGAAACSCYGVAGLAPKSKSLVDNVATLLKEEEWFKGVGICKTKKGYEISVYIFGVYGVKLSEVLSEVQKRVKYELQKTFGIPLPAVNVYVQDVKENPEE